MTGNNWLFFLLFAVLFFWSFGSIAEYKYPILAFVILAAIVSVIQRKMTTNYVLYADRDKLTVEIVKAGFETPLTTTEYRWKDLELFQYSYSTASDVELTVYLKWLAGNRNSFTRGEVEEFRNYLCNRFPKKEKKYGSLFSAPKHQSENRSRA